MSAQTLPDAARLRAALAAGRLPDERGRFGPFGGRYVPETLIPALERLERGVREHLHAQDFQQELTQQLKTWVGRPTALTFATRLSARWGAKVWLKREDLAHTGAHKINNAIGQALLAKRLGARRIVAETGAGQHGVASAAACARLGLPCTVYMGEIDMQRQAPNVGRMRLLGTKVVPVTSGDRTLRAAIDEALRDWVADPLDTYYLLGSAVGPAPVPVPGARAAGGDRPRGACPAAGRHRRAAGCAHRLRRRRLQLDRRLPCLRPRRQRRDHRRRGRRQGRRAGRQRRHRGVRPPGRAARHLFHAAAERGRPDPGDPLGVRRPRLSGRRSRARTARRRRARALRDRRRCRGARGCARAERVRGHPAGARERARHRRRQALGTAAPGTHRAGMPVGPR